VATEIEAKFVVDDPSVSRRLRTVRQLCGFELGDGERSRVLDTYLDTKDRSLVAVGLACRVRRKDDQRILLTVKGMRAAAGAIHRRAEFEIHLPRELSGARRVFDPAGWPDGPIRNRVLRVIGSKRLSRLATIRQRRVVRRVIRGVHAVALLSLDEVRMGAAGAEERFSEVEVELTGRGVLRDLKRLAGCLQREWGLRPDSRSKLERALTLLDAGAAHASHPSRRLSDPLPRTR
jgi:inorganic triphosphatase YgiF